jgi:sugar phosphate isomerase/epimerase
MISAAVTLACTSLAFHREPLEDALAAVAALGFEHVDLGAIEGWAHVQPSTLVDDPGEAGRVEQALAAAGLGAAALNAGVGPYDASRDQLARLAALVEQAERLGANVITLQPPAADGGVEEAIAQLEPVVAAAARTAIPLTLEVHRDRITERPADAAAVAERTGLGLTLDPSHIVAGPAAGEGLELLLPYTSHLHVRDATADTLEVSIGEGVVPFEEIFAGLAHDVVAGVVSVEYIGVTARSIEEDLVGAGAFVRERWPGAVAGASRVGAA